MGLHTMTDHSISEKIEYKYLSFINKVFLVVHIGFLLLFANLKINFMVYFNLGSILFYTLAFFMLQKFKIHLYVYLASIEILLHMSAATLCVGLGCNFQLCLFGVILFFFIIECILPDKKKSIDSEQSLLRCHRCLIRGGKPDFTFLSPFPDGNRYPGSRNRNFCTPADHYFHAFLTPVYGS